jgi:hypothetical protein
MFCSTTRFSVLSMKFYISANKLVYFLSTEFFSSDKVLRQLRILNLLMNARSVAILIHAPQRR